QYIQLPRIAKDFANYLELYYKYQRTYHVEDILSGKWPRTTVLELRSAAFDERLSVMGLVMARLSEEARRSRLQDALTTALHGALTEFKAALAAGRDPAEVLTELLEQRRGTMERQRLAGQLDRERRDLGQREIQILERYARDLT